MLRVLNLMVMNEMTFGENPMDLDELKLRLLAVQIFLTKREQVIS